MASIINLDNTTPAAPPGYTNVMWQGDSSVPRNVSAYVPAASSSIPTAIKYSTSWTSQTSVTVTHNLGTTAVIVQVYDSNGNQVAAQNVAITSANVVTLTFGAGFSGSVVVVGFVTGIPTQEFSVSWTAQTSVSVTHNLNSTNVIVQVYDAWGNLVTPPNVAITNVNVVTLTFGASFSGSVTIIGIASPVQQIAATWTSKTSVAIACDLVAPVIVQVYDGSGNQVASQNVAVTSAATSSAQEYSTSWTSQTSVTVTHGLGTTNVIVQVCDGSGNQVTPENIAITSANVVTLTFGASFSGSVVVMGLAMAGIPQTIITLTFGSAFSGSATVLG